MNNQSAICPPVGMISLKRELVKITRNKRMFQSGFIRPPHIFLYMLEGDGFTTALEFTTEVFLKHQLKEFNNIDPWTEMKLNDEATNLEEMIQNVDDCSVFTNIYDGVVGLNPLQILHLVGEEEYEKFFEFLNNTAETATFVFFVPSVSLTKREEELLERITILLGSENVRYIKMKEYTPHEKALIIVNYLQKEVGIYVESAVEKKLEKHLAAREDIVTAKECVQFAKSKLLPFACYDKETISITSKKVAKILSADEEADEKAVRI